MHSCSSGLGVLFVGALFIVPSSLSGTFFLRVMISCFWQVKKHGRAPVRIYNLGTYNHPSHFAHAIGGNDVASTAMTNYGRQEKVRKTALPLPYPVFLPVFDVEVAPARHPLLPCMIAWTCIA